eukprot:1155877-Pelagomonas_calceolata.AAC.1
MGCVWYSKSVFEAWLPLDLLPPACGVWVGSRDRVCVEGVERAWVGAVPCASVVVPSIRELCLLRERLPWVSCASVCVWLSGGGVAVDPGVSVDGSVAGVSPNIIRRGRDSGGLLGELSWLCITVLMESVVRF